MKWVGSLTPGSSCNSGLCHPCFAREACPLFHYLLQLFDAAVVAHFFQVSFEGLDACSPIREPAHRGETLRREVQGVGVLVGRAEYMGREG